MRHEAKPCPFCGCKVISVREISGYYRASCGGCEANAAYQESEEAAIERWNNRLGDDSTLSEFLNYLRKQTENPKCTDSFKTWVAGVVNAAATFEEKAREGADK